MAPVKELGGGGEDWKETLSFLPFPLSPLSFFWLLFYFSRGQNLEYRSSVFLYSETKLPQEKDLLLVRREVL